MALLKNRRDVVAEKRSDMHHDILHILAAVRGKPQLLNALMAGLHPIFVFDHVMIMLQEDEGRYISWLTNLQWGNGSEAVFEMGLRAAPAIVNVNELGSVVGAGAFLQGVRRAGVRQLMIAGLQTGAGRRGLLVLMSGLCDVFHRGHLDQLRKVMGMISIATSNVLDQEEMEVMQRKERGILQNKIIEQAKEIADLRCQIGSDNKSILRDRKPAWKHDGIVGGGRAMQEVFEQLEQAGPADTTVLLLGETGTGKELIARALHDISPRRDKPMVKVNCASLPASLIESELFGHEKGSFTGASDRRIGKFEQAHRGTLFLDEIGELPIELQSKLLRALQEKEIERIGGTTVIKTDLRIIAATNRDLESAVRAGRFRSDLYYRLNVFPIMLPSLRSRREDIPALAGHFVIKLTKNSGRRIPYFSARAMKELCAYSWPGNVRELEHIIERALLKTRGPVIEQVDIPWSKIDDMQEVIPDMRVKSIDEVEREHIISVLKRTRGKVSGIGGAAELLGIPSTTLNSKIRRLEIKKGLIDRR